MERHYRNPRLIVTDSARMRALGYELKQRRMARSDWGRVLEVVWGAVSPPAIAAHDGGGNSDEAARDPTGA